MHSLSNCCAFDVHCVQAIAPQSPGADQSGETATAHAQAALLQNGGCQAIADEASISCVSQELKQPHLRAEKATVLLLLSNPAEWSLHWGHNIKQAWGGLFNTARFSVLQTELAYLKQQLSEIPNLAEEAEHCLDG